MRQTNLRRHAYTYPEIWKNMQSHRFTWEGPLNLAGQASPPDSVAVGGRGEIDHTTASNAQALDA